MSARKTPARKVQARWRYLKVNEPIQRGDLFNCREPGSKWILTIRWDGALVSPIAARYRMYRRILKAKRKTPRDAR